MSKPFNINTADPRFDPNSAVRVNGFEYLPACALLDQRDGNMNAIIRLARVEMHRQNDEGDHAAALIIRRLIDQNRALRQFNTELQKEINHG